jgi:hypothetical protein
MKRVMIIIVGGLALAGCQTDQQAIPAPQVTISGPIFPASRFDCGVRPLPPDPKQVGTQAASAAAHYENRLGAWGQHCSNQLHSVGSELKASGQLVGVY